MVWCELKGEEWSAGRFAGGGEVRFVGTGEVIVVVTWFVVPGEK